MRTLPTLILIVASAASAGAAAQTSATAPPPHNAAVVYKCTAADGSVTFSDRPCSADPKKVQQVDTSGALRTGSGGHVGEIADSVADSDCQNQARKSSYGSTNAEIEQSNLHIADYQKRLAELTAPGVYLTDNAANPVDDAVKQSTLDGIHQAIEHEREFQVNANAHAASAYQAALDACADARAQRAKEKKP